MKPHLVIKLRQGGPSLLPFWGQAINDKRGVPTNIVPSVDRVLRKARIPVWVTHEYPRPRQDWTPSEIRSHLNRIYRLVLRDDRRIPSDLIRKIQYLPEVEFVRFGDIAVSDLPNAVALARRRQTDERSRRAVGVDRAHHYTRGHPDVLVAVLDTGIDEHHPEIAHACTPAGYDFVNILNDTGRFVGDYKNMDRWPFDRWVGHGTHVAGIISGRGLSMPTGVAPQCRILNVRVLGALRDGDRLVGAGLVDNINVALKWTIDQGAKVVNMSLGVKHEGGGLPYREVVDYATANDVAIVAASGNSGTRDLYYPGAYKEVIAVGAIDREGMVAAFSNYGPHVDLLAPGSEIYSSFLDSGYAFSSGTSQAAPFVTGALALLHSFARSQGRVLSNAEAQDIIEETADRIDHRFRHPTGGFGKLNIPDAVRLLSHRMGTRGEAHAFFATSPAHQTGQLSIRRT